MAEHTMDNLALGTTSRHPVLAYLALAYLVWEFKKKIDWLTSAGKASNASVGVTECKAPLKATISVFVIVILLIVINFAAILV